MGAEGRRSGRDGSGDDLEAEFRGGASRPDSPRTLDVLGEVVPLPDATVDDFGRVDTAERLRTPEAWQEWLGEPTGRDVWLEDPSGFTLQPETNYMDRAAAGTQANGYVKTGETLDSCPVWRKR